MNPKDQDFLSQPVSRQFIMANLDRDPVSFVLNPPKGFDHREAGALAGQIASRQRALKKIPDWASNDTLLFPPQKAMEQCSSAISAKHKARFLIGKSLADLTGGFGVDCYYLSQGFESSHYFEKDEELAALASHNFKSLSAATEVNAVDGLDALKRSTTQFDWLYVDPSRRDEYNRKMVGLQDYSPNVVANLDLLRSKARNILIKTSPLLDIRSALAAIPSITKVHVLEIGRECKELLLFIDESKNHQQEASVSAYSYDEKGTQLYSMDMTYEEEASAGIRLSTPLDFLYEPGAAVLKAGAFKTLCERFNVQKLAPQSHIYTSSQYVDGFPGRCWKTEQWGPYKDPEILAKLKGGRAHVLTRNFGKNADVARKELKVKEGGDQQLLLTRNAANRPFMILARKHPAQVA